jgi:hypothetical protein
MDFHRHIAAIALSAPTRRIRPAHGGEPASTTALPGVGMPWGRSSQRGSTGKRSCNGRGPGSVKGSDV